jgi:hypothetical protein
VSRKSPMLDVIASSTHQDPAGRLRVNGNGGRQNEKRNLLSLLVVFLLIILPALLLPKSDYRLPLTPEEVSEDRALCEELGGSYDNGCQPY